MHVVEDFLKKTEERLKDLSIQKLIKTHPETVQLQYWFEIDWLLVTMSKVFSSQRVENYFVKRLWLYKPIYFSSQIHVSA